MGEKRHPSKGRNARRASTDAAINLIKREATQGFINVVGLSPSAPDLSQFRRVPEDLVPPIEDPTSFHQPEEVTTQPRAVVERWDVPVRWDRESGRCFLATPEGVTYGSLQALRRRAGL